MIVKHAHLTIIALTFIFFIINFVLTMRGSDKGKVNNKLLKVGPHVLYTLFICSFIYLVVVNPLNLYPFVNGWASSKLGGFVLYILSITLALKWAKSTLWRVVGLLSAIFWLVMSARLGFADHLKSKGIVENANVYFDLSQSILTTIA
jgi:uncharacterized membrane protein SirB2